MGPVDLRIDELALIGFDGIDGDAVGEALRVELTRMLSTGGALATADAGTVHIERLDAGSIGPDASRTPATLGRHLARATHDGIVGATRVGGPIR